MVCFNEWTGDLIHIVGVSRIDTVCSITRLYRYNTTPIIAIIKALNHIIQYLYHHPHVTVMYQGKCLKSDEILHAHVAYG